MNREQFVNTDNNTDQMGQPDEGIQSFKNTLSLTKCNLGWGI